MGRVIDYDSSEKLTKNVSTQDIDPKQVSQKGRDLQALGGAVEGAGDQLMKLQEQAETTKAQNEHEKDLMDIEARFEREDISQLTTEQIEAKKTEYYTEIDNARTKASKNVTLPGPKGRWEAGEERNSNVTKAKLNTDLLKKYVSNAKAQNEIYMVQHGQNYIKTTNQKELVNENLHADTKIDEMVHTGFMTADDGEKAKVSRKEKWDQAHATHYAITNPEQFLQMVERGFYEGVDISTIDKATQTANRMIERKEKTAKASEKLIQKKSYETFALQVHDRTADLSKIEEAFTTKRITQVQFGKLRDSFGASRLTHKSDRASYMSILEIMADDAQSSQDVNDKILAERHSGKLSVIDAQHLTHLNYLKDEEIGTVAQDFSNLDQVLAEESAREKAGSERKGIIRSLIDMVKGNPRGQEIISDALSSSAKEVGNPKDLPSVVKQKLQQDFMQRHPEIAKYPKEGVTKPDRYGNLITFFPDGSYEVKSKGKK